MSNPFNTPTEAKRPYEDETFESLLKMIQDKKEKLDDLKAESSNLSAQVNAMNNEVIRKLSESNLKSKKVNGKSLTITRRKTIQIYDDSQAEEYARENGYMIEAIDKKTLTKGLDPENLPVWAKVQVSEYLSIK